MDEKTMGRSGKEMELEQKHSCLWGLGADQSAGVRRVCREIGPGICFSKNLATTPGPPGSPSQDLIDPSPPKQTWNWNRAFPCAFLRVTGSVAAELAGSD